MRHKIPKCFMIYFVLRVSPRQRRPGRFNLNLIPENRLVLYPTYFHSPPPFAHHFPPVPPAPVGRPRPPRADRSRSGFTQGQRGPRVVYATVNVARAGKPRPGPPWFIARIAGQNQYNKLLGNLRITVRSFRIVITCMVKYLKLEDVIISSSLL